MSQDGPSTGAGRVLVPGTAVGSVVRLDEPLSLWGGYDPDDGTVVDPHHPARGRQLTGRVVVMPASRGSSSSSSVLMEAIRLRTAPAAIVLLEVDPLLAVGALAAAELYDVHVPVVADRTAATLVDGTVVRVEAPEGGPATIVPVPHGQGA